jgi:hypothetical protein
MLEWQRYLTGKCSGEGGGEGACLSSSKGQAQHSATASTASLQAEGAERISVSRAEVAIWVVAGREDTRRVWLVARQVRGGWRGGGGGGRGMKQHT